MISVGSEGFVPDPEEDSLDPLMVTVKHVDGDPKVICSIAENAVTKALDALEVLSAEGWNLAYAQAIHDGRTHLATRIKMAKGLALYRGRDRR